MKKAYTISEFINLVLEEDTGTKKALKTKLKELEEEKKNMEKIYEPSADEIDSVSKKIEQVKHLLGKSEEQDSDEEKDEESEEEESDENEEES
jgi:hypothetical protein